MTKATHDPNTGDRAVAPEIQAAGRGCPGTAPGLTLETDRNRSAKADSEDGSKASPASSDISPETAAAAVALRAPSLLDLGRHLAALEIAYDAHDIVALQRSQRGRDETGLTSVDNRAAAAEAILSDRIEAVRALITTIPAKTVADVAVQIEQVAVMACRLSADGDNTVQVRGVADQIERMAYSMLPIIAAAAQLDLEEMNWRENDALRVHRFAAVGVTS